MANEISTYTHEGIELPFEDWSSTFHSFSDLASIIQTTHDAAQSLAVRAINHMQTMRNWLIGYYIVEFEQHGKDRAEYGTQLLKKLEERVDRKGLNVTLFQTSRNFYNLYPQMGGLFVPNEIYSTLSNKSENHVSVVEKSIDGQTNTIYPAVSHKFHTPPEVIVSRLSFSHIREIMSVNDPFARYFYEQECIKCTWSVRELRRQISTNLSIIIICFNEIDVVFCINISERTNGKRLLCIHGTNKGLWICFRSSRERPAVKSEPDALGKRASDYPKRTGGNKFVYH